MTYLDIDEDFYTRKNFRKILSIFIFIHLVVSVISMTIGNFNVHPLLIKASNIISQNSSEIDTNFSKFFVFALTLKMLNLYAFLGLLFFINHTRYLIVFLLIMVLFMRLFFQVNHVYSFDYLFYFVVGFIYGITLLLVFFSPFKEEFTK